MSDKKTVYMVSGLPRSGSTLLMNILGQNPEFYVTPTSGILDMLLQVRNTWDKNQAFKAQDNETSTRKKVNVLNAMFDGYYADVEQTVCFDKNRGWPSFLEMVEELRGGRENVKVLLTLRDVRDVLASFELLHRKTSALGQTPQENGDPKKSRTAVGRMEIMVDQDQPVGRAFNIVKDAFVRGWGDCMHIVEYDKLTAQPEATMKEIYQFLGKDYFNHDFDHVEQLTVEDDAAHGYVDLHKIRQQVKPQKPKWPEVFDRTVFSEPVWESVEEKSQFWRIYQSNKSS